jgi:hypothetical protein
MKVLPDRCFDPNYGRTIPDYDEINGFKRFWSHFGWSTPKPFRLNMSDAYAKASWRWPVVMDEKVNSYQPLECGDASRAVNYISKYLTKEYENTQTSKEFLWRTKMSRNLGLSIPMMIIEKCNLLQLLTILKLRSRNVLQVRARPLPLWTMKRLVMKLLLTKFKKSPLILSRYWTLVIRLKHRDNLLKRARLMIENPQLPMSHISGSLTTPNLLEAVGIELQGIVKDVEVSLFGDILIKSYVKGNTKEVRYA